MSLNVGGIDRTLRIVVGIALIASTFVVPAMSPWGWLGIIPLATGLIGWCPAYLPLGIKTCKTK